LSGLGFFKGFSWFGKVLPYTSERFFSGFRLAGQGFFRVFFLRTEGFLRYFFGQRVFLGFFWSGRFDLGFFWYGSFSGQSFSLPAPDDGW
jgi:hypothetical protein